MIIKNFQNLATDDKKELALTILECGFKAAMPHDSLKKIVKKDKLVLGKRKISLTNYDHVYVVSIGKSADLMAKVVISLTKIDGGIIVIPQKTFSLVKNDRFTVLRGSHPLPSTKSVKAAQRTLNFLAKLTEQDFVIFLISGGASSLFALPDGITLKEKQTATNLLLNSGANIQEINCVRKHISQVKGGKLIQSLRCKAIALVMSDVVGDDLSSIASGLTYFDSTKFSDAKKIIIKYGLKNKIPKNVWHHIDLGVKKLIPETPKRAKIKNYVISSNKKCLEAMSHDARKHGFDTKIIPISVNVEDAASKLVRLLTNAPRTCLVFGGEPTVKVAGKGKGGRNQELVLHLLDRLSKKNRDFIAISAGTDGIDGNTLAAGAMAFSGMSVNMKKYLQDNDSNSYFKKYGRLIFTGHTHTNLMDIGLILLF